MKFMLMATAITCWMWVVETLFSKMQLRKRRDYDDYIIIFLLVYACCYAGHAYGQEEFNLRHPVINEDTGFHIRYREYYKVTYGEMTHDISCKFVPPGTPAHYVNEDGTPSYHVWNTVQRCNEGISKQSLQLHIKKAEEYYSNAYNASLFLPETSSGQKVKELFTTVMAVIPATPASRVCTAICVYITQYGLDVWDEYEKVVFNINMCKWHNECAMLFIKHIQIVLDCLPVTCPYSGFWPIISIILEVGI